MNIFTGIHGGLFFLTIMISEYKNSCNCGKANVLTQECHTVTVMLFVYVLLICSSEMNLVTVLSLAPPPPRARARARAQSSTRLTVHSNFKQLLSARAPLFFNGRLRTQASVFTPFPVVRLLLYVFFCVGIDAEHIR